MTTLRCICDVTGHKIPIIENLGVAGPQDAIDFTDNDIATISNFPLSPRLNTLLCARNRIQSVDKRIAEQIPNLTTLVLTANHVKELADLDGLSLCGKLTHLCLLENPVTRKEVGGQDVCGIQLLEPMMLTSGVSTALQTLPDMGKSVVTIP